MSADGLGNVYISGGTQGSLGGTSAGKYDAFLSKFDANGTLLWTEQLGTSSDDNSGGVSADGLGNVYISGSTQGSLGGTNAGGLDAFVSKFDANGTLLWTEQLGTSSTEYGNDVSADGLGNVYISGDTQGSLGGTNAGGVDAFVAKFTDLPNFPGDMNGDGNVTLTDAPLLIEALVNRPAYDAHLFPVNADINGDVNQDGIFDTGDVAAFSALLGGPASAATIPEPSTLILATFALLGHGRRRRA